MNLPTPRFERKVRGNEKRKGYMSSRKALWTTLIAVAYGFGLMAYSVVFLSGGGHTLLFPIAALSGFPFWIALAWLSTNLNSKGKLLSYRILLLVQYAGVLLYVLFPKDMDQEFLQSSDALLFLVSPFAWPFYIAYGWGQHYLWRQYRESEVHSE